MSRIDLQVFKEFRTNRAPKGRADEDLALVPVNSDLIRSRRTRSRTGRHFRLGIDPRVEDSVRVRANVHWLRAVLDILINNALDATRKQRRREIVLGSRDSAQAGWVEVFVSDNGPGIPKKIQDLILRQPIPKAKGEKGTGTGLLIALQIVGIYGGEMYWEPRREGGTTMVIALPVADEGINETAPV